ncbi:4-hydroxythreonine-4-phosphate dehydrogenase PdxA [Candidatus Pelagibacter sp.]|nr:4-hydroxythreonine-4-phosphate dehydrogenase PdxA [Candidatus Pelagibacter sp.]
MKIDCIIIILGEPYSTFSEILGKYFSKKKKINKKIILIGNIKLFCNQLSKLNYKINLNIIQDYVQAKKSVINIIDIDFKFRKIFSKVTRNSENYIEKSFNKGLSIIDNNHDKFLFINGPVSKKDFLKKKYYGITEYLSNKTRSKDEVMLIYNSMLSVSPITTHIPIKNVAKNINKKIILNNVTKINNFYKAKLNKIPKFAILGLNPHCETIDNFSEEDKIIKPAIKSLRNKKIKIEGPFSADTFFIKKNIVNFDVVIGMYHDQVLTPIKTMYKFNAINITVGLPFIRISPDHGPNTSMIGKNISDPSSFFYAMKFIDKLK